MFKLYISQHFFGLRFYLSKVKSGWVYAQKALGQGKEKIMIYLKIHDFKTVENSHDVLSKTSGFGHLKIVWKISRYLHNNTCFSGQKDTWYFSHRCTRRPWCDLNHCLLLGSRPLRESHLRHPLQPHGDKIQLIRTYIHFLTLKVDVTCESTHFMYLWLQRPKPQRKIMQSLQIQQCTVVSVCKSNCLIRLYVWAPIF